jgi:hypothetical protein
MDRFQKLSELSAQVTEAIVMNYGDVRYKCGEATNKMIKLAQEQGIDLVWGAGFFSWHSHNWVIDPETGIIYDPTASQFGGRNGAVLPIEAQYGEYDCIPEEYEKYIDRRPDWTLKSWNDVKRWIPFGVEEKVGFDKVELRISKRGDEYIYVSQETKFVLDQPAVRSCLIFEYAKGWRVSVVMQDRIITRDKRVVRPTRIVRFMVHRDGSTYMAKEGQKVEHLNPAGISPSTYWMPKLAAQLIKQLTNESINAWHMENHAAGKHDGEEQYEWRCEQCRPHTPMVPIAPCEVDLVAADWDEDF